MNFDCKYKHGKTTPAFVIVEECRLNKIIDSRDHYVNVKLFTEGAGLVTENKKKHP